MLHVSIFQDYDHYCICDTPNCNKDRECFKTCKNGTTSTVTPSTTSQNHARLTCQDCGDIKNCKDINDNGEVKECDEGTVGCFYSEHYGMNDLSNHNNQWISNSIFHCRGSSRCHANRTKMCQRS